MQEALFYSKSTNGQIKCGLCPWNCILTDGQTGICKVRTNHGGTLITGVYNKVAALGSDPIEKKPLYHFYTGKNILSIGEVGCNLQCSFAKTTGYRNAKLLSSRAFIISALKKLLRKH
nr:hypothetical protein [uncultured Draconibacterium sp.]